MQAPCVRLMTSHNRKRKFYLQGDKTGVVLLGRNKMGVYWDNVVNNYFRVKKPSRCAIAQFTCMGLTGKLRTKSIKKLFHPFY